MEQKILEVLRRMQGMLDDVQIRELKGVLNMAFAGCELVEETGIRVIDRSWEDDMDDFLMSKALEGKSVETVERYRYELKRLLSYINKGVADVKPGDISGYMRAYKQIRQISNETLKGVRAVYSSFFAWLHIRERVGKNPMNMVEVIKTEKRIKKPYSDKERARLLENCENIRDRALLEFLYSTAVRVSELVHINREEICFATRDLIVFGKGGKERRVYINERTNAYLREYLQSRTDDNPALFVGNRNPHERLTKAGIEDIVRRIARRAGVEKAYPHRFRRTAATNALNRGMPVQEVAMFLGHTGLNTTLIYCTIDEEKVKRHHKKYLSA